ncbi:MAG: hypothetical protein GDA39_05755 [Hyphomonadaceae bacterium]|nr:hypothetical protein [Hyphomonadaceae bacterium]MBC6412410.1 hypothetical protein [Hyphomonadaceae bacterium]
MNGVVTDGKARPDYEDSARVEGFTSGSDPVGRSGVLSGRTGALSDRIGGRLPTP